MSWLIVQQDKNFKVVIFSDTGKVVKVKLCMSLLIELYLFIPLLVTFTMFMCQGHRIVKHFESFMFFFD